MAIYERTPCLKCVIKGSQWDLEQVARRAGTVECVKIRPIRRLRVDLTRGQFLLEDITPDTVRLVHELSTPNPPSRSYSLCQEGFGLWENYTSSLPHRSARGVCIFPCHEAGL